MTDELLLQQLQKALKLSDSATLRRCPSGAVNHVYHLQDDSYNAAVKWLGEDRFSGVKRGEQFILQQSMSRLGAAPEPLWLSVDETIWVEQWIDCSASRSEEGSSEPETLTPEHMAEVLVQLHSLPVCAHALNLYERWQHYLEIANVSQTSSLFKQVSLLESDVINSEKAHRGSTFAENNDIVICHNDLLRAHVLSATTTPPLLIDWEYAASGNRYFDIASCCLINAFTDVESVQLVNVYADKMNICPQRALSQHKLFTEIVEVTNALWCAAMDATSK